MKFPFILALGVVMFGLFSYPDGLSAEIIAQGVEQRTWRIDADTSVRGITLSNLGGRLKVGVAPHLVEVGTEVELTTFASEYFVRLGGYHRVTPLYRIMVSQPTSSQPVTLPIEVVHHGQDGGRKTLWIWGDDDIWREIASQSIPERNALRFTSSFRTLYFAIFADDTKLETGYASWYTYKNCACGASPDYQKGTKLKVTNLENGSTVVIRVNDFGPDRTVHPDRVIDLDRTAFARIAGLRTGLVRVKVEPLDPV